MIEYANLIGKKSFYIVDFYCNEYKLVIEIDGSIHKQQQKYDRIREEHLIEMGFKVIRFSNGSVLYKWDAVEKELKRVLGALDSPLTPLLKERGNDLV